MTIRTKAFVAALTLCFMLPFMAVPSSAMTMPTKWWSGRDANGIVNTDFEGQIVVENETITFDIPEFPNISYDSVDQFLSYSSNVTIEYTLYNPTDKAITAHLAYPLGGHIEYTGFCSADTSKYSITVDGNAITPELRHTYSTYSLDIDYENQFKLLTKDYISDGFLSPDTVVTKYSFAASDVKASKKYSASAAFDVKAENYPNTLLYLDRHTMPRELENGDIRLTSYCEGESETFDLYAIGEPLKEMPSWRFYEFPSAEEEDEISGKMSFVGSETMTLSDFAMKNYDTETNVSEHDWYNIVISEIQAEESYDRIVQLPGFRSNYEHLRMRWYLFDLTLQAGEKAMISVNSPIYPDIDEGYIPTVYHYAANLTTSTTWTKSGSLDVVINTPYHMTHSTESFTKTDNGYELHKDSLTTVIDQQSYATINSIDFALSTEENPEVDDSKPIGLIILIVVLAILLLPILIIGTIVTLIIDAVKFVINKVKENR